MEFYFFISALNFLGLAGRLLLKDWDRIGSDDDLGTVQVAAEVLYQATGEPLKFALVPPDGRPRDINAGTITIRSMPATDAHLEKFGKKKRGFGNFVRGMKTHMPQTPKGIQSLKDKIADATHKTPTGGGKLALHNPFAKKKFEDEVAEMEHTMAKQQQQQQPPTATATTPVSLVSGRIPSPASSPSAAAAVEGSESKATSTSIKDESEASKRSSSADPELVEEETKPKAAAMPPPVDKDLKILIEIVAGRALLIGDKTTSDPYVKVKFGGKYIHETKHILKT
jgi:hypothetical protein